MDDNMELEYQDIGENRTLCGHVSGIVPWLPSLQYAQYLTLEIGHGRRNRISNSNTLEVPGQPQR
jgi:hypothetical protein